ncbi:MAG: hypothetical protein RSB69_01355 [Odoribacter sp.]
MDNTAKALGRPEAFFCSFTPYSIATLSFGNGLGFATFRSFPRRSPFVSSSSRNEGEA